MSKPDEEKALEAEQTQATDEALEQSTTQETAVTSTPENTSTAPAPVAPAPQEPPKRSLTLADTSASSILDPNVYMQMKSISNDFFNSKAVPSAYQNTFQVLFGLQAGYEMGMQPVESLQSLTIVNGSISLWGKAIPKRLRLHGWKLKFEEGGDGDEQFCEATITNEKLGEEYTEKITFKEAEDSGYTKDNSGRLKVGWKPGMNRRLKLRYDVLDMLCKTYVPEVFGPAAGTAEVLQDVNPEDDKPSLNDQIKAATGKLNTKAKAVDHDAQEGEVVNGGNNAPAVPNS